MADEDDLVKSAKIHCTAQHAHVLLGIGGIQSSHGFIPKQSFVANPVTLTHVVDGNAQVNSFIDQNELATGELIHKESTVQILVADLDIKIIYHPPPICFGPLCSEANLELIVEAPLK